MRLLRKNTGRYPPPDNKTGDERSSHLFQVIVITFRCPSSRNKKLTGETPPPSPWGTATREMPPQLWNRSQTSGANVVTGTGYMAAQKCSTLPMRDRETGQECFHQPDHVRRKAIQRPDWPFLRKHTDQSTGPSHDRCPQNCLNHQNLSLRQRWNVRGLVNEHLKFLHSPLLLALPLHTSCIKSVDDARNQSLTTSSCPAPKPGPRGAKLLAHLRRICVYRPGSQHQPTSLSDSRRSLSARVSKRSRRAFNS